MSPGLIICVRDSPLFTKINKECTSGTHNILFGTHPNFILQRSLQSMWQKCIESCQVQHCCIIKVNTHYVIVINMQLLLCITGYWPMKWWLCITWYITGTIMMSGCGILTNGKGTRREYGQYNLDELAVSWTLVRWLSCDVKFSYYIK